jgi:hypothetical protein
MTDHYLNSTRPKGLFKVNIILSGRVFNLFFGGNYARVSWSNQRKKIQEKPSVVSYVSSVSSASAGAKMKPDFYPNCRTFIHLPGAFWSDICGQNESRLCFTLLPLNCWKFVINRQVDFFSFSRRRIAYFREVINSSWSCFSNEELILFGLLFQQSTFYSNTFPILHR